MKTAQQHNNPSLPFQTRLQPRPMQLRGIEGFYVLTADGILGQYEADGGFVKEPELTKSLEPAIAALLSQYRTGDAGQLNIGVVVPSSPDQQWKSASLVFADRTLREVYKAGNDPNAPLTSFQKRNKVKSLFRGMELVLDTKKASDPDCFRYCPVLFRPEVSNDALRRRYGIEYADEGVMLEMLNLKTNLSPEAQKHPAFSTMTEKMRQTRIDPELRSSPELMLIENSSMYEKKTNCEAPDSWSLGSPWENVREDRNVNLNDGDPVTYWLLGMFAPFNELNDAQRQFIARGHKVVRKRAGATLIERGSEDDVSVYLLDGTLELEAFDGKTMTIVGGTSRASLPISQLRPHAYTVRAATAVTVFLVSQDMVREITRITSANRNRPGIEVIEQEFSPEVMSVNVAH